MNRVFKNPIERNDAIVKEMKARAKGGFQYGERVPFLTEMAEKYDISFGNAQQLYYTRVKGKENEEEEPRQKQMELEMESTILDTVSVNSEEIRIVEYKEKIHVVSRDLLLAIGIKSSSNYLNDLLMEEDRIYTPIPSTHGLAKTLIISLDTAIAFLEIVSMQHQNLKIRANAKSTIPILKKIQRRQFNEEPASIQQLNDSFERRIYKAGEKISVRVLQIGEKTVETETVDEDKVKGTIYIADVADVYVSDLHDFFQEGEIIEVTVKRYDDRVRRLSLTTLENPYMKLKSKYKTTTQSFPYPKEEPVSFSVDESIQEQPKANEEVHKKVEENVQEAVQSEQSEPSPFLYQHEMERILGYMQNEVNLPYVSEEAKTKLKELLSHNSLFDLSVAMVKLSDQFQPDVSLLFMNKLEENLNKIKKTSP